MPRVFIRELTSPAPEIRAQTPDVQKTIGRGRAGYTAHRLQDDGRPMVRLLEVHLSEG